MESKTKTKIIRFVDMFCGLGAFHQAFKQNNTSCVQYKCVMACDVDEKLQKIYEENYGIKPQGDVHTLDFSKLPDFDILCAGFPCQPFSIAGKKEGFSNTSKGNLFYKILECVDKKNPSMIFLENVKNLESIHQGATFQTIRNELEKRNYKISYCVCNSKDYGSPQARQRIYIVCHKDKKYVFPEENRLPQVHVSNIIDKSETAFMDLSDKYTFEECEDNGGMMIYKLINKITGRGGRQGERVYSIYGHGPTICASSGGPGAKTGIYEINGKFRTLNIRECLQMFGFPSTFRYETLENKKRLLFYLGNSIVVSVLSEIIKGFEDQYFT